MSQRPKKHPPSGKKEEAKKTPQPNHLNQPLAEKQEDESTPPLFETYSFSAN